MKKSATTNTRTSKTAAAPVRKKLTVKKDTLKDLSTSPRGGAAIKGGRSSSGGSINGSMAGSIGG